MSLFPILKTSLYRFLNVVFALGHEDDEEKEKEDEHTKDLHHKHPVRRHRFEISEMKLIRKSILPIKQRVDIIIIIINEHFVEFTIG